MQITLMGCPQVQPDPGFPETVSQREIGMQEVYQGRFSGSAPVRVKRQQDIEQRGKWQHSHLPVPWETGTGVAFHIAPKGDIRAVLRTPPSHGEVTGYRMPC